MYNDMITCMNIRWTVNGILHAIMVEYFINHYHIITYVKYDIITEPMKMHLVRRSTWAILLNCADIIEIRLHKINVQFH